MIVLGAVHGVVLGVGLADVSLTLMLIGAIVLAGATVIMASLPNLRWPRRRRRTPEPGTTMVLPPISQRRVVTGRKPTLPPPGVPLPVPIVAPAGSAAGRPAGQVPALPDGRRPTTADVQRAEAVIDGFLDTDPALLAATLSSWLRQDDRNRRRH